MKIDLNADLGESFGPWKMGADAAMLQIVTSANIACGFHAGDPAEMLRTVRLCAEKGVSIGAHPGFDDLQGFGRRQIIGTPELDLGAMILYQIGALAAIARSENLTVHHVKMHGALSNMCMTDRKMAETSVNAMRSYSDDIYIMAIAATEIQRAAEQVGGPMVAEVFADRTYNDDGTLTSRSRPDALIHDPDQAADHVLRMVETQALTSVNGKTIPVRPDTICVHGDNPAAVKLAERVRNRLEQNGVTVAAF